MIKRIAELVDEQRRLTELQEAEEQQLASYKHESDVGQIPRFLRGRLTERERRLADLQQEIEARFDAAVEESLARLGVPTSGRTA